MCVAFPLNREDLATNNSHRIGHGTGPTPSVLHTEDSRRVPPSLTPEFSLGTAHIHQPAFGSSPQKSSHTYCTFAHLVDFPSGHPSYGQNKRVAFYVRPCRQPGILLRSIFEDNESPIFLFESTWGSPLVDRRPYVDPSPYFPTLWHAVCYTCVYLSVKENST